MLGPFYFSTIFPVRFNVNAQHIAHTTNNPKIINEIVLSVKQMSFAEYGFGTAITTI